MDLDWTVIHLAKLRDLCIALLKVSLQIGSLFRDNAEQQALVEYTCENSAQYLS